MVKVTTESLQRNNVEVLPWPTRSLDLSPIEHLWGVLGTHLGTLQYPPHNRNDLRLRLRKLGP